MILPTFVSALALALSTPVDVESAEVSCIANSLTAAERAELGGAVYRGSRSAAVTNRMGAAVAACARTYRWSEARAIEIGRIAYALLILARGAELLDAAGIDHRVVDAWFDAQPQATRTAPDLEESSVEALVTALHAGGIQQEALLAGVETLNLYIRGRIGLERLRHGLPLD